ncbi:cation:proton antiporter [Butyrivibrio sp. VCB2001]|uniref:cation:proton antiporter n=1 Tax=Butyrivibrio sp. VCB2001 TaxID=1280667 RepID=UPI00041C52BA|nr:cation:proton antiporter [Butyrivibrio sp. VCB2001]
MENYLILKDLAIIILVAKFMSIIAKRFKAPGVVGEILAGLILGPCLLNIVAPSEFTAQMAEIGVVLIMFSAGLETNIKELKKSGLKALLIACAGVFVPLVGGAVMFMAIHGFTPYGTENFFKALFIGCIMTATSVGITVETLKELGYLNGHVGQTILSAAIIDDVIGIIVLTVVLGMKDPSSNVAIVLGKTALFLVLSVIVGYVTYRVVKVLDAKFPHTRRIPIIGLGLCFIMAYAAEHYFGIADITGAYIAGIILCNIHDAPYIDEKININSYMIFAPIFFVSIGLKTDFSQVHADMVVFSVAFVLVAMLTKIIGCGLTSKALKFKWIDCLKIGVGMMTRGEVALIITNKGLNMNIIDSSYFTAVILLIIISSISVPLILKFLYHKAPDPA